MYVCRYYVLGQSPSTINLISHSGLRTGKNSSVFDFCNRCVVGRNISVFRLLIVISMLFLLENEIFQSKIHNGKVFLFIFLKVNVMKNEVAPKRISGKKNMKKD